MLYHDICSKCLPSTVRFFPGIHSLIQLCQNAKAVGHDAFTTKHDQTTRLQISGPRCLNNVTPHCTMRPRSSCREAKRNAERPERSKPKGCQTWQPWTLSMYVNVSCRHAVEVLNFCVKAKWWELRTTIMELKRMNMGTMILNENICRRTSSAFATSTVAPSANSLPNASSGESHIASSFDLQSCQLFTATWNRMVL